MANKSFLSFLKSLTAEELTSASLRVYEELDRQEADPEKGYTSATLERVQQAAPGMGKFIVDISSTKNVMPDDELTRRHCASVKVGAITLAAALFKLAEERDEFEEQVKE